MRLKAYNQRSHGFLEAAFREIGVAIRRLAREPRFSATAIFAFTLGIGSSTMVFSLLYGLLVRPFPSLNVERSIVFRIHDDSRPEDRGRDLFSIPEYLAFQHQNRVFQGMVGYNNTVSLSYSDGKGTREIYGTKGAGSQAGAGGAYVTSNMFDYFGVRPFVGRGLTEADAKPGAGPVFLMNYRLWRGMFHGDYGIVGKSFLLNGEPRTLVGVTPPEFQVFGAGVWFPFCLSEGVSDAPNTLRIIGRLKPNTDQKAAAADLALVIRGLSKISPNQYPERLSVVTETLVGSLVRNFVVTLYVLSVSVLLLLSIACTNVAILLLTRATRRQREIAVRASLGASRTRLIGQFLAEGLVLALTGSVFGYSLAFLERKWLFALIPSHRIPDGAAVHLSFPILVFAGGLCLLTALFCGIMPALFVSRRDLRAYLNVGRGLESGAQTGILRGCLVVAQVSLSIILLVGAGLMMRSFLALTDVNLGFRPASVLYVRLNLPKQSYETTERRRQLIENAISTIKALPSVTSAAESWSLPPLDWKSSGVTILGRPTHENWKANLSLCSAEYFQTLGLSLLRGRLFSQTEVETARHILVVNQTFSRRFFGTEDPVGQKVMINIFDDLPNTPHHAYFEIVGVVSDYVNSGLKSPPAAEALMPYTISPFGVPNILVQTHLNPEQVLPSVDRAIWSVDPNVGVDMSGSLEALLDEYAYQEPRFEFGMLTGLSIVGLVLVAIGIYSVMSYGVEIRTHEIGIRTALGADPRRIVRMVLKRGLALITGGAIIGILCSLALTRLIASQVWGISLRDSVTFVGVVVSIIAVGLLACILPARRASTIDPLIALRSE